MKYCSSLFSFLFLILSFAVQADVLLIISSGQGMYGTEDHMNNAMEELGANLIENGLRGQYRKIYRVTPYKYKESSNQEMLKTLRQIVAESSSGEKLDVFSMQHGPDGLPFDGLTFDDVKDVLPFGFLKNIYATSCSEFGTFTAKNNLDIVATERNPEFAQNLQQLGVETYLYHANDNATGIFTLPLLVKNIRDLKSWAVAGKATYEQFDLASAKLIPVFATFSEIPAFKTMLPDFVPANLDWEQVFNSRLVIGSKNKLSSNGLLKEAFAETGYEEQMVPFSPELINVLKKNCPDGMSPEMKCHGKVSAPLHVSFFTLASELQKLFSAYDPSSESCIAGTVLQPLIELYMGTKEKIRELCFKRINSNHYALKWKFEKESLFNFRASIKDLDPSISKVTLAKSGSIHFHQGSSEVRVVLNGVKVFLNGFDGEGMLKGLSSFKLRNIKISDEGNAKGRIRYGIIPISAGIESQNIEEFELPDYVKVLGIKVWKKK